MEQSFLGSHPAMDFLNTHPTPQGIPIEQIGNGRSFAAWLEGAGLLDATTASAIGRRFGAPALDAAAAEARELREWARDWIARWRNAPGDSYRAEVRRLNGLLERASYHREMVTAHEGHQLVERHRVDSADALIGLIAESIASLIVAEEPALVKQCAGAGCTLWFVDRTKAHSRLFCSATACGNKAKVAAFRERQRRRQLDAGAPDDLRSDRPAPKR